MLIKVGKMTDVYIKVNCFMVRGVVGETEAVNPFPLNHKFKLITCLVTSIINLIARWALYLVHQNTDQVNVK